MTTTPAADNRAKTKISWLDSKHSFSFGDHYDPRGGLAAIASGMPEHSYETAIAIRSRHAALHGALEGAGPLCEGDAVRSTASGGQRVTATEPAEILVWEMHADLDAT
jgi:hypothetical protein